jgi:hypothetical protein
MSPIPIVGKINRRAHKLKPNANSLYPTRYLFFDTETKEIKDNEGNTKQVLRLGWLNFYVDDRTNRQRRDDWKYFRDIDSFWTLLDNYERPHHRTVVFAHNADFDLQAVDYLVQLDKRGYVTKKAIIDSNRVILEVRRNSHTYLFLDVGNYVPHIPLKAIGDTLGIKKIELNPLEATDKQLIPYCHRDVEIIREFILRLVGFFKSQDLGNFAPTVASLSFNAYRHKFMSHSIYIHNNLEAINLERLSYRGGRCEAFYIGKLPDAQYYSLDVNSMYPFVMRNEQYPTKLLRVVHNPSSVKWESMLDKFAIIADLEIEIHEPALGYKGERLLFPVGRFRTVLTSPEIEYVRQCGRILKTYRYAIYEKAPIFTNFVDYFYGERLKYEHQGDKVNAYFCKRALNSLYGKFGQKSRKMETSKYEPPTNRSYYHVVDLPKREHTLYMKIGKTWMKEGYYEEGYNSFVAICSFVTAYARMYLWSLMVQAGNRNVFYCDTDSLFTNRTGYTRLVSKISDNKVLGKLSLKSMSRDFEVRGCKIYKFESSYIIKGIRKPKGFESSFDQTRFTRTRTSLRKSWFGGIVIQHLKKVLSYDYKKGTVQGDCWVSPPVLEAS